MPNRNVAFLAQFDSAGETRTACNRATAALKRLRIPAKVNQAEWERHFQSEDEQFSKLLRIGQFLVNKRGPLHAVHNAQESAALVVLLY